MLPMLRQGARAALPRPARFARPVPVSRAVLAYPTPQAGLFARSNSTESPRNERLVGSSSSLRAQGHKRDAANRSGAILASPKPPRRRMEALSAPLRNAPSSTRGPVLQLIAHTTAEHYDLVNLSLKLRELGVKWDEVPEGDRDRAFVIGPWKGRGGVERLISGKDIRRTFPSLAPTGSGIDDIAEEEDAEQHMADTSSGSSSNTGFGYGERGEIWVFSSGSFVTWGLTEEEGRAFLRDVIRDARGSRVEVDRLSAGEYEVEEMDFVVDPTAKTDIRGNLILLGRPPELSTFHPSPSLSSLLARYTLSLSLSRSSSLSVLEDRLDTHIASVSTLPRALEKSGAQPMGRKDVIRKIGELMSLRMAVNTRGGGLDDTPEFYWSEPELEAYFDLIATEFEIEERIDAINKKIDYAQEVQHTLRALLTEASAHQLELIITLLIAVEVVIVLIREGPELMHKVAYPIINYLNSFIPPSSEAHAHAEAKSIADVGQEIKEGVRDVIRHSELGGLEMGKLGGGGGSGSDATLADERIV